MVRSTSSAVRDAIAGVNGKFMEAFNRGDARNCAFGTYTADAQIMPPNCDIIQGREGIQKFWQGAMDMGIASAALQTVELEAHGDAVVEIGKYVLKAIDGRPIDEGKYQVVWHREEGQWKWHRDIWNSSRPAAA